MGSNPKKEEPTTAPELEEAVVDSAADSAADNAQVEGAEAPVDDEPAEEPEAVEGEVDADEPDQEAPLLVRHAVKHVSGEHVTLGDGVAEALARGQKVDKIYLPSAGTEVPAEEFKFVATGEALA